MLFHLNWPGWHVFTCLHCRWETAQKISILHTPCYACGRWLKSGHREFVQRKIFPSLGCEGWAWGRSWGGQLSGVWIREGAGTQQGHANLDMCIVHCNCTPSSCFSICITVHCIALRYTYISYSAWHWLMASYCIALHGWIVLHCTQSKGQTKVHKYIHTDTKPRVLHCITMHYNALQRNVIKCDTMQCNALYDVALTLVRVRERLLTGAQLEPALLSHWLAIVVTLITIIVIIITITLISKWHTKPDHVSVIDSRFAKHDQISFVVSYKMALCELSGNIFQATKLDSQLMFAQKSNFVPKEKIF